MKLKSLASSPNGTMTPEERAEKISSQWHTIGNNIDFREEIEKDITAEIRAAVEDAQIVMAGELTKADLAHRDQAADLARYMAYEDAVKIVKFNIGNSLETPFDRALVDGAISVLEARAKDKAAERK